MDKADFYGELLARIPHLTEPEIEKIKSRVKQGFEVLTKGYGIDLRQKMSESLYPCDNAGQVTIQNIPFISLCEHHLLPMMGVCHVAYLPKDHVLGLSHIPEVVGILSARLQLQERLTREIAETLRDLTDARGVGVMMTATHVCMALEGLDKLGQQVTTSCFLGDSVTL